MVSKPARSIFSKLIGTAIALAAAVVAKKGVSIIWKALSGHQAPDLDDGDNGDGDASLAEIVAASVITGAVVALVRVLAVRAAARAMR
ncbi:MAG TPA: DUF4235 domain-containing protein [Pengzhenrongella sp.]